MDEFDFSTKYKLISGEEITITFDEDELSILVISEAGEKIGNINLREEGKGYYITWMYLDQLGPKYKYQGIGRKCLTFFKTAYQTNLYAAPDDGIVREDGSHLTGDAPGFISKMRDEGIVENI